MLKFSAIKFPSPISSHSKGFVFQQSENSTVFRPYFVQTGNIQALGETLSSEAITQTLSSGN